jgi:hypothetical protein
VSDEELGRFPFGDREEVGIYDAGDGDVKLVWFDEQDYHWPVTIPRDMLEPLTAALARILAERPIPKGGKS